MSSKTESIAFHKYQLLQFTYLIQDNVKPFEDALANVYSVIAPWVTQAISVLGQGSKVVINSEDQYEVFDNPCASDPSHILLSNNHFGLILNEPAGKITILVVKHLVKLIVQAWPDNCDPRQAVNVILKAFHLPYCVTSRLSIQNSVFEGLLLTKKRKASPDTNSDTGPSSSMKRARKDGVSGSESAGPSTSTGHTNTGRAGSADTSGRAANAAANNASTKTTSAKMRVRDRWGIHLREVPANAKTTQRAFQRFICGICGLLTQTDVLPPATEAQKHYDKRFDDVDDVREHMRTLVNDSRTAVSAAKELATKLIRDAKLITGPIANDIARIPENHLATVFTMILKAGLKGFCPDLEGPVQSKYNQLYRHLAVSGFQFLSSSFALAALEVNTKIAEDSELLGDMYDNYTYGTLAQKTRMERRRPGSLSDSIKHSNEFKARGRLARVRFDTAVRLGLRKPVQRTVFVQEVHSDDEHTSGGTQRTEELDPAAEQYRQRNAKPGQRKPQTRIRSDSPLPASDFGVILPADVPINYFTPEFFNALTLKERARYVNTGVAFPLADFAFDKAHDGWKTMSKKDFMEMYGNNVLAQYDVPTQEEMDTIPDSDVDDDQDIEINLEDTDDEAEMDVDDEV
ncbi:heterokaryon incompatibility protein Het-C-domain-containing protein [Mycena albidolilacea]|uniref:Heterokaryon incompatibility protein Het-C-domain-containing protein n=1 Tax=Mycena albidolilacea TaxID=1033008 RepID=A0AAD6ZLH1_9AGAR|nr:heterokaryon incompatibility protein Het-C-domain-containing protein [Mycena albidolilacea]